MAADGGRGAGGITIHDTLSGKRSSLSGQGTNAVSIYLCGVTVYDDAHIGHARTIITFDVLRRHLEGRGIRATMVQNFTDVDDKIIARARDEGVQASELGERYIRRYHEEFERLNVLKADSYPRATEHIPDIIGFIRDLIEGGAAYVAKNGVYFAVSEFAQYGKLSGKKTDQLRSGARIEIDEAKRDPLDFALWKFDSGHPSWDSPWGAGRPGWHIECSAMSTKYLGDCIDIHGGGRDLIFPHHENEIAQSETRTGSMFARIWMHVGMVTIGGEKMSKSLGNIRSVRRALEDWGPNVIRLFCLSGHYSKPVDYSDKNLRESLARWRQIEACHYELMHAAGGAGSKSGGGPVDAGTAGRLADAGGRFDAALDDDLNTHLAVSAVMDVVSDANALAADCALDPGWAAGAGAELSRMSRILGLRVPDVDPAEAAAIDSEVEARNGLRRQGRYEEADAARDRLRARHVELFDRGDKTVWVKREKIGADARSSI